MCFQFPNPTEVVKYEQNIVKYAEKVWENVVQNLIYI